MENRSHNFIEAEKANLVFCEYCALIVSFDDLSKVIFESVHKKAEEGCPCAKRDAYI